MASKIVTTEVLRAYLIEGKSYHVCLIYDSKYEEQSRYATTSRRKSCNLQRKRK